MISSREIISKKFYYNNLFWDYIFNFKNLSGFYEYDYRNMNHYKKRILDIKKGYSERSRVKIYDIIKKYNKDIGCGKKTIENIEKFKREDSLVVIGGQQPGFLTGPLFIIFKVLTVLKISGYLEKELKIPVVPCFWNASDDNDPGQINNLNIINKKAESISLDLSDFNSETRYSDIYIQKARFTKIIEKLEDILYPSSFKADIISFYKSSLENASDSCAGRQGKINISSFFSSIIVKMFSDYGIVIIDPAGDELKRISFDLLKFDSGGHKQIAGLINNAGKGLNRRGYHNQLNSMPGTLDFFFNVKNTRKKIYSDGNDLFKISNKKYSKSELWKIIEESPGSVSLNVVLRPLFQDEFLPVLCSVCGPGEVSYFAQLKPVYDFMNLKMPIIYPRFSATMIEKKIWKLIKRLKIQDSELELGEDEMIKKAIKKNLKINVEKLLLDSENGIQRLLNKLEESVSDFEMNISSSFDRIKRNIKKEIKVLNKKIYSEFKKHDELTVESVNKIYANIFPNGKLQEREINITGYLNKYGFELVKNLYQVIKPIDFSHKFLEID